LRIQSVPQTTQLITITAVSLLTLFKKIIPAYAETHTEPKYEMQRC
jgi:hypothetical protein